MVHSAMIKKIVFCLVLFFCHSVQLLETGYKYPSNEFIENDNLNNDLKCAFLFSGLTHMLITQILIGPAYNMSTKLTASNVSYYKNTIKYHIASLYTLKVKMGSLWLLNLYLNIIPGLPEYSKDMPADYLKLLDTHEYVIKKLRKDLTGCRLGNSFDNFKAMIKENPNPSQDELRDMVNKNDNMARGLLSINQIYTNSFVREVIEKINMRRLFMNNMGNNKMIKKDLMNVFNVQVNWSDITDRLEKSYNDTRTLDWSNDHLQKIKSYYTLTYTFLKIIIFRLALRHITYLKDDISADNHVHYAQEWYILVKQFGNMLNLTNELHIGGLLTAFNNLIKGTEKIGSVERYVVEILHSLCLPLGCKAIEPFKIDNKEFQIPYESSNKYITMALKNNATSRVPIEYNSLENTRVFLLYLGQAFENVDFSLIQSLIETIDEIQLENNMEKFISVHLDFLDSDCS